MFFASLILLSALALSVLAAFVSIEGMTALFPAGGMMIIILMSTLEISKIFLTAWLHAHRNDTRIGSFHRFYLIASVVVLMALTSMGTFGFLSRSHLEQGNSLADVNLKIAQLETRVNQVRADRATLDGRKRQLDSSIESAIKTIKNTRDSQSVEKLIGGQKKERDQIIKDMADKDKEINQVTTTDLMPLKLQVATVELKLGPVKYISSMFGFTDTEFAVKVVIVMITLIFDPLAVLLFLAGIISFEKKIQPEPPEKETILPKSPAVQMPVIVPESKPEPLPEPPTPVSEPEQPKPPMQQEPLIQPPEPIPEPIVHPMNEPIQIYTVAPVKPVDEEVKPVILEETDKEQLLKILERSPGLLQGIIETVQESTKHIDPAEQAFIEEQGRVGLVGALGAPWNRGSST
jgi:hypothetical protein